MFTVICYLYGLVNEFLVGTASSCFLSCDPQYARERRVSQVSTENIWIVYVSCMTFGYTSFSSFPFFLLMAFITKLNNLILFLPHIPHFYFFCNYSVLLKQ